jgi:acetylornithine deacetylase/succinyl-diaminopimelate desuccinylase-like protein
MPSAIADDQQDSVLDLLNKLLSVPSEQTALMEREPAVTSFIAEVVAALVRAAGLVPVLDDMGNLTAQLGTGQEPRRFLLTYAMTHAAAGMTDAYAPEVRDGAGYGISGPVVRGRGACEQKGALAAALDALRRLAADGGPRHGTLIFACCTAGETGTHDAARRIVDQLPGNIHEAVVAVGTDGDVCAGNKGRIDITVTVRGRASHSSSPDRGLNAIDGAVRVLQRLASLRTEPPDRWLGEPTVTPTSLHTGPDATHTVQDTAIITVDRRLVSSVSAAEAVARVRQAIGDLSPFGVDVAAGPFMYPARLEPDHPLVTSFSAVVQSVRKERPAIVYSSASADAGLLNHAGIPCISYGPGSVRLAHTDDDVVSLRQVAQASQVLARWAGGHAAGRSRI